MDSKEYKFWIVATPIGNLEDLSQRARRIIESADVLACEDKRRAGRLCQLAGLKRPPILALVNEFTEEESIPKIISDIKDGKTVALISDAGMPSISDPGRKLIEAVFDEGIEISAAPGPTSISTALALSGMDANRYVFEGFLPRKGQKRAARLAYMAGETRTLVIFESPHRLEKCIQDLCEALGGSRKIFIARELTKLYENLWKGELEDALELTAQPSYKKGEFVIVIEGIKRSS